jgi:hypothetical protein
MNYTGAGVTCTKSGVTGICDVTSGGGSGTVTSVGIGTTTATSGTVTNPTTTPVLSINLNTSGVQDTNINWTSFPASGFAKWNGSSTPTADTNTYITGNQSITLSGDISGTGATAITTAIGALKVQSSNVNWSSITGSLNKEGINWTSFPAAGFMKFNGQSSPTADTSTYLTAETDPQVGTLTNTKWCTTDGSAVNCTSDAPGGVGSNYWALGNVGINTTNNVGIGTINPGFALDVNGGARFLGSGDSLIGSNLGIGTTTVPQRLYVAGTGEFQGFKMNNGNTAGMVLTSTSVGVGTWLALPAGGSGAPTDADYLVGTANGSLSGEIAVGTTPGGELGGTWASPTLDDSVTVNGWTLGSASLTAASNLTSNGFVKTSGGVGTLSVDTSTYLTAESDPQVGTLTNTKWCTTDGSAVNCTTDAPAGTGNVSNTGTPADNQVAIWTNSTTVEGSNSFIFNGTNVGIGTLLPLSVLEARGATGLTISGQQNLSLGGKCSANITADAASALSVSGCRYYSFTSDNATSTSRTFCLLAGTEGQVITLFADVVSTNEIELGDGAAGACAGSTGAATFLVGVWPATTNQNNDSATIIYRTTASGAAAAGWYETNRAAN